MNRKVAAKMHYRARCIERYGRAPSIKDMDLHRLLLKNNTAFYCKDCGATIKGIVPLDNINIVAVYDKDIDGMVTAGVKM